VNFKYIITPFKMNIEQGVVALDGLAPSPKA